MKKRANKLDQFASRLKEWAAEGKSLEQIRDGLKADGCVAALSSISEYLRRQREEDAEASMLARIANGGEMNAELDRAYAKCPEELQDSIGRLMKVMQTNIMTLQVHGAANPKLLTLANSMSQTMLNYLSGLTKAKLEDRKLGLTERRVAVLEDSQARAKQELQKLRDPKAQLQDADRAAIVDKVDEILGLK